MMTNLFSMFDPTNFLLNSAWMLPLFMLFMPMLKNFSKYNNLIKKLMMSLKKEFYSNTQSSLSINTLIPIFMAIFSMNIISMIPSVFASSSQLSFILPLTLPMWLMSIIYFLLFKTKKFLAHLVPSGSPYPLMPALVIIELISNMIRPITLTVRLMANITAGHLLMHLLSSFSCNYMMNPMMLILIPTSMILTTLEIGVALIQSYILCTLIALYSSEIH